MIRQHVTPTRTPLGHLGDLVRRICRAKPGSLHYHLCFALGDVRGTLLWWLLAVVTAIISPLWYAWDWVCYRVALEFREERSIVWLGLMLVGACVGTVALFDAWPWVISTASQAAATASAWASKWLAAWGALV